MIYAITGSSGFIGTALMKHLIANGDVVVPVSQYQLSDVKTLSILLHDFGADKIFHLAAYGNHYNQKEDDLIIEINIKYTLKLFKAAKGIPVVNISTSSVILKQQTLYSISKNTGEQMSTMFTNITNVRPYSVYGVGEAGHRFIPTVIRHLLSGEKMQLDGSATHDWIYIGDFITALLAGHTEIGTGEKRTNFEIVSILEKISGRKLDYELTKLRNYDNEDWVCKSGVEHRSIEAGLLKCWEYYREL